MVKAMVDACHDTTVFMSSRDDAERESVPKMGRIREQIGRCGLLRRVMSLAHSPKVAGSNPAPANPTF